jgi:hypothetical protein
MQPDWFDIISLVTNLVLAALAIGLSVFFFWESAKVERRVVDMLGKVEMMSTSIQQVQSELIRTAWARYVAGVPLPLANEAVEEVEGEPPHRQEGAEAAQPATEGEATNYTSILQSLDAKALAALRMLVVNSSGPSTFIRQAMTDPVKSEWAWLLDGGPHDTIRLEDFRAGLRSLIEHGVAEGIREDSAGANVVVKLCGGFLAYWRLVGFGFQERLLEMLQTSELAEQYSNASPMG